MVRIVFVGAATLAATTLFLALAMGQGPPPPPPPPPPGGPLRGLDPSEVTRFVVGLKQFQESEVPADGLGPVFTENACVKCHNAGTPGGSSERLVTRIGRLVNGVYDPLVAYGGPVIEDQGIGKFKGVNFVGEVVPKQATIVVKRRPTAIFGLGLVDAVPDAVFVAIAQQQANMNPATAGRPNMGTDPATGLIRVGRFGWKAQEPTLFAFAGDAYVNELGVTTPLFPNENCPQGNCSLLAANPARTNPNDLDNGDLLAFTDFMTFLAPPPPAPIGRAEQTGQLIFQQIGCASCHLPSLQTGPSPVAALNHVAFEPYSDFLLHDMGSLGDGIVQNESTQREMRTAPLWGLRYQAALLHDGRTTSIPQAILAHDGQARASRNVFNTLNASQQSQLVAFLKSL